MSSLQPCREPACSLESFLARPTSLQGVQDSCGLLQSGKVVGVGLDLLAGLTGQSGYSSAHSQGNSLSMWGKGEDKKGQISWPHGGCLCRSGYQRGLGPGPQLIGKVTTLPQPVISWKCELGPWVGDLTAHWPWNSQPPLL